MSFFKEHALLLPCDFVIILLKISYTGNYSFDTQILK